MKLLSDEQRKILKEKKKKYKGITGETEWYRTDEILKTESNWYFIFGERSNGKSFAIKEQIILKDVFEGMANPEGRGKKRFMYVRRYSEDVTPDAVLQWLADMCIVPEGRKKSVIDELTDGRYNGFDVSKKKIFAVYRDEDGEIGPDRYLIGYFVNIGDAERIKSQSFKDVGNIIFEEFIASKPYLNRECEKFENIVSTIARRDFVRVFCIGNNNKRDNEYFRYFGLNHTIVQEEGTIEVYEKVNGYLEDGSESYIRIAVEFCPDNVKSKPGMFFGRGMQGVSGSYNADPQPKMYQDEINELDEVYRVYCEYHDLKYLCQLLLNKEQTGYFWYVKAYNRTIPDGERVVSGKTSTDPMSTLGFIPLFPAEEKFFRLMEQGKVFFCDDLTGTEFKRACKFFFQNRFYSEDV